MAFEDDDNRKLNDPARTDAERSRAEERVKQLARIVCICKGINLGRVLRGMEGCETVQDVNRKTGCGSGGCQGQRCGPRVKILLQKKKEAEGGS